VKRWVHKTKGGILHNNDAVADRIKYQLTQTMESKLAHDVAPVRLRCFDAETKRDRNLLRTVSLGHQLLSKKDAGLTCSTLPLYSSATCVLDGSVSMGAIRLHSSGGFQ
jgi:hypothetical protein